jgi:hypothetical protein
MNTKTRRLLQSSLTILAVEIVSLVALFSVLNSGQVQTAPAPSPRPTLNNETHINQELQIIVDDFIPQPYLGQSEYRYNRLGGDRGVLNNSLVEWGRGQVTTTIAASNTWGGLWTSLNHPITEALPINFSAILPPQILPAYQSQITGVTARIIRGKLGKTLRLELKDRNGTLQWNKQTTLSGGEQIVSAYLPPLGGIKEFLWVLDDAVAGDFVVVDSVSFTATGLVRDKAKDLSGQFDAIQATGSLAAATAVAAQLGIIEQDSARQIVDKVSQTLLTDMPRFQGLWPHFVNVSQTVPISIAPGTEWSSVDTVIGAMGLLGAQSGLGLDTSGTEEMLRSVAWVKMDSTRGISHGYHYNRQPIPFAWDVFGGETWLVELAYASAVTEVTSLTFPSPPTANGSGFIDELAWLFVLPPTDLDYWGNDWETYRKAAADVQIQYYSTNFPGSCFDQLGLFGLSAAEVPTPWTVGSIYQALGVGGRFAPPNDGSWLLGAPVVTPHYAAMIASLRPQEAIAMWTWLINETSFSPLNNVESLLFPDGSPCTAEGIEWNHLKGSWNLALQTLGWGNYLLQRDRQIPVTQQATVHNTFLRSGYSLLVPNGIKEIYLPLIVTDS